MEPDRETGEQLVKDGRATQIICTTETYTLYLDHPSLLQSLQWHDYQHSRGVQVIKIWISAKSMPKETPRYIATHDVF